MGMSNEELLNSLQQMIDAAEKRMAEMCGMQLYKKREGFTQEDIYTLCGRDDAYYKTATYSCELSNNIS